MRARMTQIRENIPDSGAFGLAKSNKGPPAPGQTKNLIGIKYFSRVETNKAQEAFCFKSLRPIISAQLKIQFQKFLFRF